MGKQCSLSDPRIKNNAILPSLIHASFSLISLYSDYPRLFLLSIIKSNIMFELLIRNSIKSSQCQPFEQIPLPGGEPVLWPPQAGHQHRLHQSGTAAADAEAFQSGLVTEQGVYP